MEFYSALEDAKATLLFDAKYCAAKARMLETDLKYMEESYSQTLNWLQVLEILLEKLPADESNASDRLWLNAQQSVAHRKLSSCDDAAQLELKAKIAVLLARRMCMKNWVPDSAPVYQKTINQKS